MAELIAISGSIRAGSLNEKLALLAVQCAKAEGIDAEYVDLRNYPLPIYNYDLDNSDDRLESIIKLKHVFLSSNKIIISSPENNASISPLLKNVIDWVSRSEEGEPPFAYSAFRGKAVGLLSASPGRFAGIRGLNHLKDILNAVFAIVMPEQLCVANAYEAFNDLNQLRDDNYKEILRSMILSVLKVPKV